MNQNSALDVYTKRSELFTLVTPAEVKTETGLQANINSDTLYVPIKTATQLYIKPLLGETLFNSLKTHFIAANYDANRLPDGSTLPDNVNYKELYYKLYNALCWWSFVESLIMIAVKLDETGIMFNNASFSDNAEAAGYNLVFNKQKRIAESYTDELRCYINDVVIAKTLPQDQQDSGTTEYSLFMPYDYSKRCNNC